MGQSSFAESGQIAEQAAPVVSGLPVLELGIVNDGTDVPALDEAIIWGGEIYEVRVRGEQAGLLAERIVRAVNSHEALVKALEAARNELMMLGDPGSTAEQVVDQIDAALASAREVQP